LHFEHTGTDDRVSTTNTEAHLPESAVVNRPFDILDGGWSSKELPRPSGQTTVHQAEKGYALGGTYAALSTGGPSGLWLWGHIAAVHKGPGGRSRFAAILVIRDASNYIYAATPYKTLTVGGDALSDRRKRKKNWGQFVIRGRTLEAHNNGTELYVDIIGSRNRKNFGEYAWEGVEKAFKESPEKFMEMFGYKEAK